MERGKWGKKGRKGDFASCLCSVSDARRKKILTIILDSCGSVGMIEWVTEALRGAVENTWTI